MRTAPQERCGKYSRKRPARTQWTPRNSSTVQSCITALRSASIRASHSLSSAPELSGTGQETVPGQAARKRFRRVSMRSSAQRPSPRFPLSGRCASGAWRPERTGRMFLRRRPRKTRQSQRPALRGRSRRKTRRFGSAEFPPTGAGRISRSQVPTPAGRASSHHRSSHPNRRAKSSGFSECASRQDAVKKACSVSSLTMPRPKKKRCRQRPANFFCIRRRDIPSAGRPSASPTAVPSKTPRILSRLFPCSIAISPACPSRLNFRFHRQYVEGGFSGFKHFAQVRAAQAAPASAPDGGGYLCDGLPAERFRHPLQVGERMGITQAGANRLFTMRHFSLRFRKIFGGCRGAGRAPASRKFIFAILYGGMRSKSSGGVSEELAGRSRFV